MWFSNVSYGEARVLVSTTEADCNSDTEARKEAIRLTRSAEDL